MSQDRSSQSAAPTSPNAGFLEVARIVAPHGLRGEVRALLITDFPERFAATERLYIGPKRVPYEVEAARLHRGMVILKLRGVDTVAQAESLRGALVAVPEREAVALPEGSYFWHQIIGLEVVTVEGERLGTVEEILPTGSNDVYVVRQAGREVLLPAIAQVVKSIDLEKRRILVELMPGLRE